MQAFDRTEIWNFCGAEAEEARTNNDQLLQQHPFDTRAGTVPNLISRISLQYD